jgi:hypothetical protein
MTTQRELRIRENPLDPERNLFVKYRSEPKKVEAKPVDKA